MKVQRVVPLLFLSLLLDDSDARECVQVQWKNETFFKANDQGKEEQLPGECLPGPVFFSDTGQKFCLARTAGQEDSSLLVCNNRPKTYRLPQNLMPSSYKLKLYIFLHRSSQLKSEQQMKPNSTRGEVEIIFRCNEPTNQVLFHADSKFIAIDYDSVMVTGKSNQGMKLS